MSLNNILQDYSQGPSLLRRAVDGMTREQVLARPVPGKWSTLEVVCHIADFEPVFADRMKRVLAEENPTLLGADEQCFAAALAYQERDLAEELGIIEITRSQMARILRLAGPAAFARSGTHNERGPLTVQQLLEGATRHIVHHLGFIHEKRQALGLPR